MRYFIFVKGLEAGGPYWSLEYAKEEALKSVSHLLTDMEIRDDKGRPLYVAKWHEGWHDPDFDPDPLLDLGETGWYEGWKKGAV
jgi:hypothetical protein